MYQKISLYALAFSLATPGIAQGAKGQLISDSGAGSPKGKTEHRGGDPFVIPDPPILKKIIIQDIISTDEHRAAIINDEVRFVGDDVLGARITKITNATVYFTFNKRYLSKYLEQKPEGLEMTLPIPAAKRRVMVKKHIGKAVLFSDKDNDISSIREWMKCLGYDPKNEKCLEGRDHLMLRFYEQFRERHESQDQDEESGFRRPHLKRGEYNPKRRKI